RIGDIVSKRMKVKVRSLNMKENRVEWKPIVGWSRSGGTDKWIRIIVAGNKKNGRSNRILVSPEHRVLTEYGWKEDKEIDPGMNVFVSGTKISREQEQVILGGLLGDGYLSKGNTPCYSESHSLKQEQYLLWKARVLLNFNPSIRRDIIKL